MRGRASAIALATVVAALALAAAGCGGDDEASGDETTVAVQTETTVEETTTVEESEETTDADTGVGALADEDCIELASVGAKFSEALGATGQSADFEATTRFFDELVEKAPGEIKGDLAILAKAWTEMAAALKDVDLTSGQPSPATIAKLQQLSTKFNTPELQQASTNLQKWATEHCGTTTP